MVVMPQNPGPLLQILPSRDLRFQDLIKVFWVGKCQPTPDDLKPFLEIRKSRVLSALEWLVAHNCHYNDLTINYSLLSSWPEEFIPSQISANITQVDASDHSEREGYVASLESDNFENDLQAASNDILPDDTVFASGSLYTDLNGDRVNCDQQLLQRLASSIEGTAPTTDANEAEGVMDFGECDIVGDEDDPLNNSNEHSAAPAEIQVISDMVFGRRRPYQVFGLIHYILLQHSLLSFQSGLVVIWINAPSRFHWKRLQNGL